MFKLKGDKDQLPSLKKQLPLLFISLMALASACFSSSQQADKAKIIQGFAQSLEQQFRDVPQMDIAHYLKHKNSPSLVLVDGRSPTEQAVSMIAGALTQREFEAALKDSRGGSLKNKKIVIYCTIGARSSRYAQSLRKKGLQAYNLHQGILGWAWAAQNFEKDGLKTKKVHVYNKAWNFLPEDYEGVYTHVPAK